MSRTVRPEDSISNISRSNSQASRHSNSSSPSRSSSHHSGSSSMSRSSSTSHGSAASSASRMRDLQVARLDDRDYQGGSSTGSSTSSTHSSRSERTVRANGSSTGSSHSDRTVRAISESGRAHSEVWSSRSGFVSHSGRSEAQPRGRPEGLGSLRSVTGSNSGRSNSGSRSGSSSSGRSSSSGFPRRAPENSSRSMVAFNDRQPNRTREEDSLRSASDRALISEGVERGLITPIAPVTVNIHFHGNGGGLVRLGGPPRPLFSPHDGLPPRCSYHATFPDYSSCGYCRGVREEVDHFHRGE